VSSPQDWGRFLSQQVRRFTLAGFFHFSPFASCGAALTLLVNGRRRDNSRIMNGQIAFSLNAAPH